MSDGANRPGASIRVTAICGSMNPNSTTKLALAMALKGTAEFTDHTRLIELRDYKLVFVGQTDAKDYPRDVERLRAELRESQAIILGTPEYHGTLSGALKAMLDLMGPDEFEGKIVGLVGVAGGITGAIQSLNTLRTIGRNLHCWVLPGQISIAESGTVFRDDKILDSALEERLLNLGRQVVKFASVQQRIREDEFVKMWEGLPRW